jgi:hypothetical protein
MTPGNLKSGAPPRASQRRARQQPAPLPPQFAPGDRVRWNGRHTGTVSRICADNMIEVQDDGTVIGRSATWHLLPEALTRLPR